MPLTCAIVHGGQFAHCNLEARFLSQFPDDELARRLIDVCPPSRPISARYMRAKEIDYYEKEVAEAANGRRSRRVRG
jgi:hypothetical protein